jgi:Mg-chelatase subunit ChlD
VEFRLSHPEWVWWGLALAPLVLLGLRWFSGMSAIRRWSAVLLRCALLAMILLLLAGASAVRRTDRFCAVIVADVSGSMDRPVGALSGLAFPDPAEASRWASRPALEFVRRFVEEASSRRGPEDLVGVVAFAGQSAVVLSPTRALTADWPTDLPLGEGTNLEEAIRLARAVLPPDAAGRLILISDGVQTAGDALAAARQASVSGSRGARGDRGVVPISVVPVEYDIAKEVFVESVDAPPRAPAGSTASVRVTLTSTAAATGTLRLLDDAASVDLNGPDPGDGVRVELRAGQNVVPLSVPLGDGRVHRFRAVFEPDVAAGPDGRPALVGDTLTRNNTGEGFTITPGQGSVLLLDGVNNGGGTTLARTLREGGFSVEVRAAEQMPGDLLQLGSYDLIVLENTPAEAVTPEKQALLVSYVKDLGGGLITVGGRQSYAAGGWRGSKVEPILPVKLDLPDRVVVPEVAIAFVLDNSGSMNMRVMGSRRSQQEIANEAAALAVMSLDKSDLVGVTTFNESYDVLIPVSENGKPEETAARIRRIAAGGGTQAGPAIRDAAVQLLKLRAKNKHILVMSDGKSIDYTELPGLCASLAAQGITISTISVGDKGDPETMRLMAESGGGAHYNVINPEVLPKIFLKAVRVVRSPLVREEPFEPRTGQAGSPLLAGVGNIGTLGGLALTALRPDPTITNALLSPQGEPVLAHWQVELGRVTSFTPDASTWAAEWIRSPSYRKFWLQAARLTSRAELGGAGMEARATAAEGRLSIRLDASGGGPDRRGPLDGLDVPVTVYSPTGEPHEIRLAQTAPGVYEGSMAAEESGTYITLIRPRTTGESPRRLAPVVAGASSQGGVEYRQLRSNAGLLRQLADETGGRVLSLTTPGEANIFDRGGVPPLEVLSPVWRPMLAWAIVLLLLDIATRRVAWDRWVSGEFGDGLAARAALAVQERGTRAAATLEALRKGAGVEGGPGAGGGGVGVGYQAPVLSERDAAELARAARDRRRAERLGGSAPATTTPEAPAAPESGLMAAKRRAAERYREDP